MKLLGFCFGPESFWNLYFTFEADDESFQRAWDVKLSRFELVLVKSFKVLADIWRKSSDYDLLF